MRLLIILPCVCCEKCQWISVTSLSLCCLAKGWFISSIVMATARLKTELVISLFVVLLRGCCFQALWWQQQSEVKRCEKSFSLFNFTVIFAASQGANVFGAPGVFTWASVKTHVSVNSRSHRPLVGFRSELSKRHGNSSTQFKTSSNSWSVWFGLDLFTLFSALGPFHPLTSATPLSIIGQLSTKHNSFKCWSPWNSPCLHQV